MQTQAVEDVGVVDRRVASYLARCAGKHSERFVIPSIIGLRLWATHGPEAAVHESLDRLVAIGRIRPAFRTVKGETVSGYIVLPERLWRREKQPKLRPVSADLTLSASDCEFLKACGISTD
jgi:hypothetical protein